MDLLLDFFTYISLILIPLAAYSVLFKEDKSKDWNYLIKYLYGKKIVKKYQVKCRKSLEKSDILRLEDVKEIKSNQHTDNHFIYGIDQLGNSLSIKITIRSQLMAEVYICLRLSDGRIYKIPGDNIEICSLSNHLWKTKDIRIETVEPFKILRIIYNGLLEDKTRNIKEHVKFNFIWSSAGRPQFYPQDAATGLLAQALANEKWRDGDWLRLLGDGRGYEQFGALRGKISGDSFDQELDLNLPSCRTRFWGSDEKLAVENSAHLIISGKDGALFSIWAKKYKRRASLKYGSVILNHGEIRTIDDLDLDLDVITKHKHDLPVATIHVTANKKVYKCILHLDQEKALEMRNDESNGYELTNAVAECQIDTRPGRGIIEIWQNHVGPGIELPKPLIIEKQFDTLPSDYVLSFRSEYATSVKLTGGKGSSLAMLTTMGSSDFSVPDGFIVTTNAFNKQLDINFNLKKAVAILDDICCQRTSGDLESACAETVKQFTNELILQEIIESVKIALSSVKNDEVISNQRFAVRSSGVSEDGDELSAAGQNETFLGCQNFEDIIKAISKCWASLFTYQSVQYRHQHGLPIKTEMAVVVQLMVPADCAGVLFTCHPTTNNPAHLVITANHGLGESVVSGHSEPDTVIVSRDLKILSKSPGSKLKVIKMTDDGVDEFSSENADFSISDQQALKLAQVGIHLETAFGNARDIEWAFYRDRLYLLQSRPVTTLENWSDDELLCELDVAVMTENNLYTTANTGEVFAGAMTVLTSTSVVSIIDQSVQMHLSNNMYDPYVKKCSCVIQHHVFIEAIYSFYKNTSQHTNFISKIIDLTMFGHPVINDEVNLLAIHKFGLQTKTEGLKQSLQMFKFAWSNSENVKICKKLSSSTNIDIDEDRDTLKDIYVKIEQMFPTFLEISRIHSTATSASVFYQIVAVRTLLEDNTEFQLEHYKDISELFASCNDVISAQVPEILEKIARTLAENDKMNEFSKIAPKDGRDWLRDNCSAAAQLFEEFLSEHGHRAFCEFDLKNEHWALSPDEVIKMIQANRAQAVKSHIKIVKTPDDVIKSLLTPFKRSSSPKILKFIMNRARDAVGLRKQTKSEVVRCVTKLRIAYRILANKMRLAGLIPNEGLIFHLTHYEIGQVINGARKPALIRKALRRQRLFPKWNELRYPELNFGYPRPDNDDEIEVGGGDVTCVGTPVCAGVVKARACVITDLKEIQQLQKGDILITYATDIGWSPYFPIISGIVTELGGLVSHGAVIAREYGLPCIVGVKKATRLFKTGDIVILSGTTGVLELAEERKSEAELLY